MIPNEPFLKTLQDLGIDFFAGVPDSLLKHICACIYDNVDAGRQVITANEGGAVALAAGYHLATGKIPLVYMQNSGLGNSINPLLSLADPEVYSIPMLLLVGWRGEPGVPDEPQHVKQGRVQGSLLDAMEIPYETIGPDSDNYAEIVRSLIEKADSEKRPAALVVRRGTFEPYVRNQDKQESHTLTRREALDVLVQSLDDQDIVVSTTGMQSREIFDIRAETQTGHHRDFLTVGSMGHCSQIALGIALKNRFRNVYCFDGDGSVLMHMGSLAIIGNNAPRNFRHVVINNGAHDSVGGQPTVGFSIDIPAIATACGYRECRRADDRAGLIENLDWLKSTAGPVLLEVRVHKGVQKEPGRPTRKPVENKTDFMNNLKSAGKLNV
ncbi:phosphonopyruvate decarboxylase [Natronogracilivirga saccharolytica]|uniref:Phosphonopyruvate decarboxylase n=1 Tax=Natronogracilivirga saccharolytica TaxID=2812953 RepID=A0A8J7UWS1_9BACT|nr:phosphonopyruvate decarboxylase [Natronogracilivirga saccharolytica]MBP3193937.1 phosphonopyruvate decarboxylase [Natronogracilivirga saccharolytica]